MTNICGKGLSGIGTGYHSTYFYNGSFLETFDFGTIQSYFYHTSIFFQYRTRPTHTLTRCRKLVADATAEDVPIKRVGKQRVYIIIYYNLVARARTAPPDLHNNGHIGPNTHTHTHTHT